MHYVYILKSNSSPPGAEARTHYYVGNTSDLKRRIAEHNRGDSSHTAKYRPWRLVNYFAFLSRNKAEAFEHYLKTRAGRSFQLRHFGEWSQSPRLWTLPQDRIRQSLFKETFLIIWRKTTSSQNAKKMWGLSFLKIGCEFTLNIKRRIQRV